MANRGALLALLAIAMIAAGCTQTRRHVAPTQTLINAMHLPLYPSATPLTASENYASSVVGTQHDVMVIFETRDRAEVVAAYYEARLPQRVRSYVFGPMHLFQFYEKNAQKSVAVMTIRDRTMIELISDWYMLGPQPSTSPHGVGRSG